MKGKHLSDKQKALICVRFASGKTNLSTAKLLGVDRSTVEKVIKTIYKPKYNNPIVIVLESSI